MSKKSTFDTEQLTDSAYYILLSLIEEKHGYAIMQYISDISSKEINIGPATLYTLLKKMNLSELIEQIVGSDTRQKKYKITVTGYKLLEKELERRRKMVDIGYKIINKKGDN